MRSIVMVGLIGLVGCTQAPKELPALHPVTGKVSIQGKVLESGQVSLNPEKDTPDLIVNGSIQSDGTYKVTTNQNGKRVDGAPAGKYRVSVHAGSSGNIPILYLFPKMFEVAEKANQWELELSKAQKQ